jgi:hypothetical protein
MSVAEYEQLRRRCPETASGRDTPSCVGSTSSERFGGSWTSSASTMRDTWQPLTDSG